MHADRTAVIDGNVRFTYRQWRARARRFASALRTAGLQPGDRVAFLALNSEPLLLRFNASVEFVTRKCERLAIEGHC